MFKKIGLFIVMILFVVTVCFGASTITTDQTVNVKEGVDYVMYYGTIAFTPDSTGKYYTQWMYIHGLNFNNAFIAAWCSDYAAETEDINTFVKWSMKPDSTVMFAWTDEDTLNGMDQLTTGVVKRDTVNIDQGVTNISFNVARYFQLFFQGMSGNPAGTVLNWYVYFEKKEGSEAWGSGGRGKFSNYVENDAN